MKTSNKNNGNAVDQNTTELDYLKFLQDNSGCLGNINESSFFKSIINVEVGAGQNIAGKNEDTRALRDVDDAKSK